tara:strand:+ start:342 stop:698 length:357 start_codon:yes stop_codon:yes gene_type:complete
MPQKNIELRLTTAERFLLIRRREKVSRSTFAKKHKMTAYRVNKIEKGRSRNNNLELLLKPTVNEIAYVLRRRSKLKINSLAKLMKVSKQTILNREAGRRSADKNITFLVKYMNETLHG